MTEPRPLNLVDGLLAEIKRVRDVIMPQYREIGPAGGLSLALMQRDIDAAEEALGLGDVETMIAAYRELRGWKS